jgi:hypothetical protein
LEIAIVMRRRDLLVGSLALAQLAASGRSLAQAPATRAAVVIGVNKTGGLPVLRAAVSGAKSVATWLNGEGFNVKLIVDEARPVTAQEVKQAVMPLALDPAIKQLVVYFAGHGINVGYNEYWLLSGAPNDLNEAVSLVECWELAHRSKIGHVVFISDACRSQGGNFGSLLRGTLILPDPQPPGPRQSTVDRFLATNPGAPSYEVAVAANNYAGIYTETFLDAFRKPVKEMIRRVDDQDVIPNRMLYDYLEREVPARLAAINPVLESQVPDSRIETRGEVLNYIGRALAAPVVVAAAPPAKVTTLDIAKHELSISTAGAFSTIRKFDPQIIAEAASNSGFQATQNTILEAKRPDSFETKTGFSINGASVRLALATGDAKAEVVSPGGPDQPALVRISQPIERAVTAALMFGDGSGTVVAALPGFIGTLTVAEGRLISVTYVPSRNSHRWLDYSEVSGRLDKLRALVATSAKYGVFRFEGSKEERERAASGMADQIRILKGIDPTLGIYAAYAYADANLMNQVQSVYSFMRGDLEANLFDVALVADALAGKRIDNPADVVPLCPMLTQGWQLLRVKNVRLLDQIERARGDMRQSLWTTFGPSGMDSIFSAMNTLRRT